MTGQTSPDAQYRTTVDLTGSWQFVTDPTAEGRDAEWHDPRTEWPDRARTVEVPHAWQEIPAFRDYTGTAWYRRTVTLDPSPNRDELLRFGAVDFDATVWVNGRKIGENRGGYLPFTVDVTEAIVHGENTITVAVTDPEDISEIPHGKQGDPWYHRVSGIWQDVTLESVPRSRTIDLRVTPNLQNDTATFDLETLADGADHAALSARLTIQQDDVRIATTEMDIAADGTATTTIEFEDPAYWTPETPVLYDVTVELLVDGSIVDRYEDYFGMRSVSVQDGHIHLNGEPYPLRGALDQGYYPKTLYRPFDDELLEREIRMAKDLGFNLLRKHIKPAHPEFIELADRLGILVWEEPANPKRYTNRSRQLLCEQLRDLIERDYNSPSVVAWSIYNEEWGIGSADGDDSLWVDSDKQDYLESLYHRTRERDQTRIICDNSGWAHVATDINDYHEYFVAPDRIDAWRDRLAEIVDHPRDNYGDARTVPEDAPIVVSEFGTWGLSDVPALLDHYGGDPPWFTHNFLPEGLKRPAGVANRFDDGHISNVFDSLSELAVAWQDREFQSIAPIIADMRENEDVAGYVLTELTDIEWEFNGILDYLREEKQFTDSFAKVNAPVSVFLDPTTHVAWSGDRVPVDLIVVNDTNEPVEASIEWSGPSRRGTVDVWVPAYDATRVPDAFVAFAGAVSTLEQFEVTASLQDWDLSTSRPLFVGPKDEPPAETTVHATDSGLHAALAERGYETVSNPSEADIALVANPDSVDGSTLVVPDADGVIDYTDQFDYVDLPERESWNICSSLVYQDLLDPVDTVPGWAFEDIYPYAYVADPNSDDDVSIGYTEGWLATDGAIAMVRQTDDSQTGVCTLRVTDTYGEHPVSTAVVDRLLARIA